MRAMFRKIKTIRMLGWLCILGTLIISYWLLCDVNVHDNSDWSNLNLTCIMYMNLASTYATISSSIPLPLKMCFFIYPASTLATKWFRQSSFHLHDKICTWILLLLKHRFLLKSSFYFRFQYFHQSSFCLHTELFHSSSS